MFRLLAILQLTRAALAFTAVADAWAVLLLRRGGVPPVGTHDFRILISRMVVTGIVSLGLYGFGMALNDLLDARHDRIFSPRRPIPSGRVPTRTAMVVCLLLVMTSLFSAAMLSAFGLPEPLRGATTASAAAIGVDERLPWPFLFAMATAFLIVFYDATSKYLGGIGLLTLGAIRALHCLIGNPKTELLFLSMILLTHVVVISTIAYKLENKRPRLHGMDYVVVVGGLAVGNGLAVWRMMVKGTFSHGVGPMLIGPGIAALVYASWAVWLLSNRNRTPRQKGERLMLMGLFWLFVYDASMLLSNGQWLASVAVILLLICAMGSFFGIRALSRAIGQQKLEYRTTEKES
jgi:4-hydroxybenzoate polyprenyltransferase